MELFVNVLLIVGTLSAATFSWVLAKRVRKLSDLDQGLGAAISALSSQVSDMKAALSSAQRQAISSTHEIEDLTTRAEKAATRLELLLASLHEAETPQSEDPVRARKRKVAQLRRQKHMASEAKSKKMAVNASSDPIIPPNDPTRQELMDSITNIIGSLQK